jgi:recombination protein RecT
MTSTEKKILASQSETQERINKFNKGREEITNLLNSYRVQISKLLPNFIRPDAFISSFLMYVLKNPDLMDCSRHSLLGCAFKLAQYGLIPDDVTGQAYLSYEYNRSKVKECTFIIGYKGLITLAKRSGQIEDVETEVVYAANENDGDYFDYDLGLTKKLEHKPVGLDDPNRITHFYAIMYLPGGRQSFKVLTRKAVEKIRDEALQGKAPGSKPFIVWTKKFDEMGMKTAIRKLFKNTPISSDMMNAISTDEAADYGAQNAASYFVDFMPEYANEIAQTVITEAAAEKEEEREIKKVQKNAKSKDKAEKVAAGTMDLLKKREALEKKNATKRRVGGDRGKE